MPDIPNGSGRDPMSTGAIGSTDPAGIAGILRSVAVYRLRPGHHRGLVRLYRPFVPAAGLAFDVGAHVGDRVRAFRALGARVVAVEPGAAAGRVLRLLHGRDPQVVVVPEAVGAAPGEALFSVNSRNPTVSTLSPAFVAGTAGAPGWEGQRWDRSERVRVTTVDRLIAAHGQPDFIKLDVEGHEAAALAGLSAANAPPALSFEVVTAMRGEGVAALDRAVALGYRRFRLSLGESHRFVGGWTDVESMRRTIETLPDAANSGDVYAVRDGHPALLEEGGWR
jgi:FkbM family methyltransferase